MILEVEFPKLMICKKERLNQFLEYYVTRELEFEKVKLSFWKKVNFLSK